MSNTLPISHKHKNRIPRTHKAVEGNGVLTQDAAMQLSLADTVVSERSQTQEAPCCMIPFMLDVQIHRDRKQMNGCSRRR